MRFVLNLFKRPDLIQNTTFFIYAFIQILKCCFLIIWFLIILTKPENTALQD